MQLEANKIRLNAFERSGTEPVLVFLHHWGGSSRTWGQVIAAVTVKNRVLALDQRGWGGSDRPTSGYDMSTLADDTLAAISAARSERFVVIGHSMGGKVCQLVASRRPIGLLGLILVAPSPAGGVQIPTEQREAMLGAYNSIASTEATLEHVLTALPLTMEAKQHLIEDSLRGSAEAKRAWPEWGIAEDVSANLGRINVPTLIVAADQDRVDSPALIEREVQSRIAGARLHIVAGSGHLLPLEAPAQVAGQIDEFCRSLR